MRVTKQPEILARGGDLNNPAPTAGVARECEAVRESMLERPCRATSAVGGSSPLAVLYLLIPPGGEDVAH